MQHPAVPELAHTRTRPIHWLATAVAVAAVVAASSFVQPRDATAAQSGSPETAAAPAPAAAAPDADSVHYPLECGTAEPEITDRATGDLDGDQRPETVAVVRCKAGSGTPPHGIYVITQPHTGEPRIVATLVDPKERLTVTDFEVHDGTVEATLLGYSAPTVPSCCPDTREKAGWQWKDQSFVRSQQSAAKSV
ncbi:hypothetical protein DSC45_09085 [Streptomyces sp. YIM 130001]|uniref:hypothetical protein n=1 Tax=Streptomyces sp. YIM 130001 TaxID=2259644 RepID=UPI000E6488A0|nr:hypothetical protein [Streptomyces sp. YIM 130001]RII18762.1 hypothetical protein DSC45_09085 [Streptomyces sp. YIM 130001]